MGVEPRALAVRALLHLPRVVANWHHWMTLRARPYFYENGHYVSPRQLRER